MNDHDTDVVERETHVVHETQGRRGGMLAGFALALLLVVGGIVAYLVVSDDDDDGRIDVDVPSVDLDVDTNE